jgi:hypothetical protein
MIALDTMTSIDLSTLSTLLMTHPQFHHQVQKIIHPTQPTMQEMIESTPALHAWHDSLKSEAIFDSELKMSVVFRQPTDDQNETQMANYLQISYAAPDKLQVYAPEHVDTLMHEFASQ